MPTSSLTYIPKYIQVGIFRMKIHHLAALVACVTGLCRKTKFKTLGSRTIDQKILFCANGAKTVTLDQTLVPSHGKQEFGEHGGLKAGRCHGGLENKSVTEGSLWRIEIEAFTVRLA
jgi:hypothetical protein